MDLGLNLHVVHVAGTRMISQGTDGLSRSLLLEGVSAGNDMLSYIDIAATAIERQPGLINYVRSWSDKWVIVLTTEEWFVKGHGISGSMLNKDGIWIPTHAQNGMIYLWSPPPIIADVALEEALKATHKRSDATHIFLIPQLCMSQWIRLFSKLCDFSFKLPTFSSNWLENMHEPLFIGISLPYSRYSPWALRRTPLLVDMERELREVLSSGKGDGRDILWELV